MYVRYGGQLKLDSRSSAGVRWVPHPLDRPGCFEGSAGRDDQRRRHPELSRAGGLPGKPGEQRLAPARSKGQLKGNRAANDAASSSNAGSR